MTIFSVSVDFYSRDVTVTIIESDLTDPPYRATISRLWLAELHKVMRTQQRNPDQPIDKAYRGYICYAGMIDDIRPDTP